MKPDWLIWSRTFRIFISALFCPPDETKPGRMNHIFSPLNTWNCTGHWWRTRQSSIESAKREREIKREQSRQKNNPFSCFIKCHFMFCVDPLFPSVLYQMMSSQFPSAYNGLVYVCLCACVHTVYQCYLGGIPFTKWVWEWRSGCVVVRYLSSQPRWNSWRRPCCTGRWGHSTQ